MGFKHSSGPLQTEMATHVPKTAPFQCKTCSNCNTYYIQDKGYENKQNAAPVMLFVISIPRYITNVVTLCNGSFQKTCSGTLPIQV